MEFFVSFGIYFVGAGVIGLGAAWAVREVASGAGIAWRGDGWPRGIQEEEPSSDWGARFRTPAALARRAAEALANGVIEDLPDRDSAGVPIQPVRR